MTLKTCLSVKYCPLIREQLRAAERCCLEPPQFGSPSLALRNDTATRAVAPGGREGEGCRRGRGSHRRRQHAFFADRQFPLHPVGHPLAQLAPRRGTRAASVGPFGRLLVLLQYLNFKMFPSPTHSLSRHCACVHARCSVRPQLLRPSPLRRRLIKRKRFCRLPTQISPRYRLAYNTTVLLCDPRMWFLISRFGYAPVLGIFISAKCRRRHFASSSFLASCLLLK